MSFNYNKLKGRIIEIFATQAEFAKQMGWSERTMSLKMNGAVYWKQPEIVKAIHLLNLDYSDIVLYFFTIEVQVA